MLPGVNPTPSAILDPGDSLGQEDNWFLGSMDSRFLLTRVPRKGRVEVLHIVMGREYERLSCHRAFTAKHMIVAHFHFPEPHPLYGFHRMTVMGLGSCGG